MVFLEVLICSSSTKRGLSGPEINEQKFSSGVLNSFCILIVTYARKFMQILDFYAQIWSLHVSNGWSVMHLSGSDYIMHSEAWAIYVHFVLHSAEQMELDCQKPSAANMLSTLQSFSCGWKGGKKSKESILLPQLQSTLNELPSGQCTAQSLKGKRKKEKKKAANNHFCFFLVYKICQ